MNGGKQPDKQKKLHQRGNWRGNQHKSFYLVEIMEFHSSSINLFLSSSIIELGCCKPHKEHHLKGV